MDFKASCGELANIGNQLASENENITANIKKIENAVDQLKTVWKDGASEKYCASLLEYLKSISSLVAYYKTIGSYAIKVSDKYEEADKNASRKYTTRAVMDNLYYDSKYYELVNEADLVDGVHYEGVDK